MNGTPPSPQRKSAGRTSRLLGVQIPGGVNSPRSGYGIDFCRGRPYNSRWPEHPGRAGAFLRTTTTHHQERETACEQ